MCHTLSKIPVAVTESASERCRLGRWIMIFCARTCSNRLSRSLSSNQHLVQRVKHYSVVIEFLQFFIALKTRSEAC